MSGTVNVAVVAVVGLIFDMGRVDGDTTGLLFWSFVDLAVVGELGTTRGRQHLGDSSSQGRLSVVDVA